MLIVIEYITRISRKTGNPREVYKMQKSTTNTKIFSDDFFPPNFDVCFILDNLEFGPKIVEVAFSALDV